MYTYHKRNAIHIPMQYGQDTRSAIDFLSLDSWAEVPVRKRILLKMSIGPSSRVIALDIRKQANDSRTTMKASILPSDRKECSQL